MADEAKKEGAKPPEPVTIETVGRVYTWPGDSPHPVGSLLSLPADHADELLALDHVKRAPEKVEAAPAKPDATAA